MQGAGWGVVALRDPSLWAGKLRLTGPFGPASGHCPDGPSWGAPLHTSPMGHATVRVRQGPGQHELLETEWGGLGATFSNLWGELGIPKAQGQCPPRYRGRQVAEAPRPREGGRGGHQLICAPCLPSAPLAGAQGPSVSTFLFKMPPILGKAPLCGLPSPALCLSLPLLPHLVGGGVEPDASQPRLLPAPRLRAEELREVESSQPPGSHLGPAGSEPPSSMQDPPTLGFTQTSPRSRLRAVM